MSSHQSDVGEPGEPGRRVEDLLSVLEVSRDLATLIDLQPLLERIEQSARKVLDCERASVFVHDPATDELESRVATGVTSVRFPAGLGLAGEAFRGGQTINVPDAYADPRFNPEIDRLTGFTTRSILTCPLLGGRDERVGVLQALNKRGGGFDARDVVLAGTLSAQAGVAVQRQLLLAEQARAQRIQSDLEAARTIQRALLPHRPPAVEGFDLAGWNLPADETGGDLFDFFRLPGGRLAVVVVDVSGHGVGPAIVAAECRAFFRAVAEGEEDPGRVVARVNGLLVDGLPDNRFATAFYGVLHPDQGRLVYASAGHAPILVLRRSGGAVLELGSHAPPLGVLPVLTIPAPTGIDLSPGDLCAIVTDGCYEGSGAGGERYGVRRLTDQLASDPEANAAEILDGLRTDLLAFTAGRPRQDDLTAVIVRRH